MLTRFLTLCLVSGRQSGKQQKRARKCAAWPGQVARFEPPYNISARRILSQYINSKKGYAQMV